MSQSAATGATTADSLGARLADLRAANPHRYPRDYAAELGVSEAELTPVFYGERVQPLYDLEALLASLSRLPRIKLMARVSYAVLEIFTKVDFASKDGLLISDISPSFVTIDPNEIRSVLFISPEKPEDNAAILLFDRQGVAALKLYLAANEFDTALLALPTKRIVTPRSDTSASLEAARDRYLGDFSPPFVAGEDAPRRLIESAAPKGQNLAFDLVNSAIAVLIRHRPEKVVDARGWLNILDADFNLHLKEEAVTRIAARGNDLKQALRIENADGEAITIYSLEIK